MDLPIPYAIAPGSATAVLEDDTPAPGSATAVLEDDTPAPGSATAALEDDAPAPGSATVAPEDATAVQEGDASARDDDAPAQVNDAAAPEGGAAVRVTDTGARPHDASVRENREDMGLLAVMDALVDEQRVTQRELARRTGLNLKKVNYCLHKLLDKGHVKFQRAVSNPDKRAYLYVLTPTGLQAKSRLTYRFLRNALQFYNDVEARMRQRLMEMAASGVERILLYGASDAARIVVSVMHDSGVRVAGVVDGKEAEGSFHGVPLLGAGEMQQHEWDGVLITDLGDVERDEAALQELGVAPERIWRLS